MGKIFYVKGSQTKNSIYLNVPVIAAKRLGRYCITPTCTIGFGEAGTLANSPTDASPSTLSRQAFYRKELFYAFPGGLLGIAPGFAALSKFGAATKEAAKCLPQKKSHAKRDDCDDDDVLG